MRLPTLIATVARVLESVAMSSAFDRLPELDRPAPVAEQRPHEATHHGRTSSDPYHWLRDPGYPVVTNEDVLSHLRAENEYFHEFLSSNEALVDTLFDEFKGRIDENDESVPYISNGYEYRWYYRPGEDYRTHSRRPLDTPEGDSSTEAVFLDENTLAEGHDYFVITGWTISPDNRLLAYAFDVDGDERCVAHIVDLATGERLADELTDVAGHVSFTADGSALVYAELDPDRWHTKRIRSHQLGASQSDDVTLYEENDDGFFLGFSKTSSREFFFISASRGEAEELWVVPSDLSSEPTLMVSRNVECVLQADHAHGQFHILANDTHKNFRLATTPDHTPAHEHWQTVVDGSDDVHWLGLQTFDGFIALKSRDRGYDKIHIRGYSSAGEGGAGDIDDAATIDFPSDVCVASLSTNPEFVQAHLRVSYESMVTPNTIFDVDTATRELTTRKVAKVPSGYDESAYETERIMVTARDGVEVPVSIVRKKGWAQDGSHPLWLYGYGAYGLTIPASFSTERLSALDRGFAYAIAHVRGGAMMGYPWYLDGKLEKRTNTFNDFVDVANHLVAADYVAAGNISISGRSAGGELMGAVILDSPELWRSVNLGVPFVDVLATMLDVSLPLTPPEWAEWGNPLESPEVYDLIAGYSPYDNITARDYPPMFVSGGLNDPRVTYWEPAKWTARMRELKTDNNLLVMRMNMGAGHFANSGRYGRLRDTAEEYAFMLLAHGITS